MANSKNIYEFLNEVDFNIEDYEKEELTDIEKQNLKRSVRKNMKKKFNLKKFGSIAAALILTIGVFGQTSLGKNVYATAGSKISEISYSVGKALGIERNIEPYANVVNKVVEINGVEVKLNDVIIDRNELIFTTTVNTNKTVDDVYFDCDIYINGKKLIDYGGFGIYGTVESAKTLFHQLYSFEINDMETKGDIDIRIVLSNLNYYRRELEKSDIKEEKIKGKWEFEFTASGSELMANTHTLPLDYSFNIDNTEYILEEFRFNPINKKIYGKIEGEHKELEYVIILRGEDNLGNKIEFPLLSADWEKIIFRYNNYYRDLAEEITSINLTPYALRYPEEGGRVEEDDWEKVGEEFTIYINK